MERVLVSIVVLGSTGCLRAGNFHCATDNDCFQGNTFGVCESVGYCSFPDPSCSAGQRYGDQSGSYAGQCVQTGGGADAGLDARTDAPLQSDAPLQTVQFLGHSGLSASGGSTGLGFGFQVPGGTNRFLLVSVQIGALCADASSPTVSTVTYGGAPLTQLASIVGTPCNLGATRTEHWGLVNPLISQSEVQVSLANGSAERLSVEAYVFEGVNQVLPVRASRTMEGAGATVSVVVPSAIGDLVLDTVGASAAILPPPQPQHELYVSNSGLASVTISNDAASTVPGAATVSPTWTLSTIGDWQTIASSIQP
jgi:hypothetical protein